jgi:hypothetical protein
MTYPWTTRTVSWRSLIAVATATLLTVVAIDVALRRVLSYPPPKKEVEDGIRELVASDPSMLVIGSSHARTFDSVGAAIRRRAPDGERLVSIPVEYGKLTSYEWVLGHRVWPLLDARKATNPSRPALRRIMLVTEWWDSCDPDDGGPASNLPARAWSLGDFLGDVARNGVTAYNRNYVRNRWRELFERSILVRDRGLEQLIPMLRERVRPLSPERRDALLAAQTQHWQELVEHGVDCMWSPRQVAALDRMLAEFDRRGLQVTVLLYPRKPGTLTDKARATTLPRFATLMADRAASHDAQFIDMTSTSPLRDDDFAEDFDHVTGTGNHRFAAWALDGELAWMAAPDRGALVTPAGGRP